MPKGKRITEELRREVYSLWEQGFSKVEIGKRVGVSDVTVGKILRSKPTDEGLKSCPRCGIKSKKRRKILLVVRWRYQKRSGQAA